MFSSGSRRAPFSALSAQAEDPLCDDRFDAGAQPARGREPRVILTMTYHRQAFELFTDNASALPPAPEDIVHLRGSYHYAPTSARAAEITVDWLGELFARIPGTGYYGMRVAGGFRAHRPAGTFKSLRILVNNARANVDFTVDRVGLQRSGATGMDITVYESEDQPFAAAYQRLVGQRLVVSAIGIYQKTGLWGALTVAHDAQDLPGDTVARCLRAAAQLLTDRLNQKNAPAVASVLETSPRVPIAADQFANKINLMLACAPAGGVAAAVAVYSLGNRARFDAGAARRCIRHVAQRILETTRAEDFVAIYKDEAVLIGLRGADDTICNHVFDRIQRKLKATIPEACDGGVLHRTLAAGESWCDDDSQQLADRARR